MLMPTIALFLLEASLLMSGLPGAQVCQEILTITVPFKEGKIYVCNNVSYQKGLGHTPGTPSITTLSYTIDPTWVIRNGYHS